MKQMLTLGEMVAKIEKEVMQRKDYIVDTRNLTPLFNEDKQPMIGVQGNGNLSIRPHAHGQIAAKTKIPKPFYDRLLTDYPEEWRGLVSAIFTKEAEPRMVRAVGTEMRAMLSDRYRRLDNYELLKHGVLPTLETMNDTRLRFESAGLTETHMYLKISVPQVQGEIAKGDIVHGGFVVKNSEVGASSLGVYPFFTRLVCMNGMMLTTFGQRKFHIGGRLEESVEIFSDETLRQDDRAFFMKLRDMIQACIHPDHFEEMLTVMRRSVEKEVADPVKVLAQYDLTKEEIGLAQQVLTINMERDGSNLWSVANAVTQVAGTVASYDRASQLEAIGGQIAGAA